MVPQNALSKWPPPEAIMKMVFLTSLFWILEYSRLLGTFLFPLHFQCSLDPNSRQISHIKWSNPWEILDKAPSLHNFTLGHLSGENWTHFSSQGLVQI